jgi:hypothetical protein
MRAKPKKGFHEPFSSGLFLERESTISFQQERRMSSEGDWWKHTTEQPGFLVTQFSTIPL